MRRSVDEGVARHLAALNGGWLPRKPTAPSAATVSGGGHGGAASVFDHDQMIRRRRVGKRCSPTRAFSACHRRHNCTHRLGEGARLFAELRPHPALDAVPETLVAPGSEMRQLRAARDGQTARCLNGIAIFSSCLDDIDAIIIDGSMALFRHIAHRGGVSTTCCVLAFCPLQTLSAHRCGTAKPA